MAYRINSNNVINDDSSLIIGQGNTASRPATPAEGMIRFNTDTNKYEVYSSAAWKDFTYTRQKISDNDLVLQYFNSNPNNSQFIKLDGSIASQSALPRIYNRIGLTTSGSASSQNVTVGNSAEDPYTSYNKLIYVSHLNLLVRSGLSVNSDNSVIRLASSSSGVSWTTLTYGTTADVTALGSGNGIVILATGTGIRTSTDLVSWTVRTSNTTTSISDFAYGFPGSHTYVRVGAGGTIGSSTDGITWTARSSPTVNNLNSVVYGNGGFYAGGASGTVLESDDGITWTTVSVANLGTGTVNNIKYYNGVFIITASNGIYRDPGSGFTRVRTGAATDVTYLKQSVWLGAVSSTLLLSNDNGVTWSTLETVSANPSGGEVGISINRIESNGDGSRAAFVGLPTLFGNRTFPYDFDPTTEFKLSTSVNSGGKSGYITKG